MYTDTDDAAGPATCRWCGYKQPRIKWEKQTMSNNYKHGDRVPSEVLCVRLDELATAVTRGPTQMMREFDMRVPAELDRDADLVLSQAAARIRELEAKLKL